MKKSAIVLALVTLLAPASARADWLFTPNIGFTFGGDAADREHLTYGASIGWMGGGIFGFEADLHYTPEFFEPHDSDIDFIDDSNVLTFMGNAIIGIPIGGQHGGGFRPFGIAGVGLIQGELRSVEEALDIDNNEFGFNLGVGAMGFFNDHVGFRGDLRYVRSFTEFDLDIEDVEDIEALRDIGAGDFDFWRASIGVTLRW